VITTDDPAFTAPGDMPARIDAHLVTNGQQPCENHAQMARSILESLASKYRDVFRTLEQLAGKRLDTLHIVGGGSQNRLLNQFTADAVERRVITGPVEATATGNVLMQLVALGVVPDLPAARAIIGKQAGIEIYNPR
jgi:sugar (pentulose or hexulose) kinase